MIAPVVSRVLRKNGFMIVSSRKRHGVLVTRSLKGATVSVQIDAEPKGNQIAHEAAMVLREKGYFVAQDGTLLFVSKS